MHVPGLKVECCTVAVVQKFFHEIVRALVCGAGLMVGLYVSWLGCMGLSKIGMRCVQCYLVPFRAINLLESCPYALSFIEFPLPTIILPVEADVIPGAVQQLVLESYPVKVALLLW